MKVFKNNRKYAKRGRLQSLNNRINFSMDKMTVEFDRILKKHLPKFEEQPQQVNLKLPKLKKVTNTETSKIELPKLFKCLVSSNTFL